MIRSEGIDGARYILHFRVPRKGTWYEDAAAPDDAPEDAIDAATVAAAVIRPDAVVDRGGGVRGTQQVGCGLVGRGRLG